MGDEFSNSGNGNWWKASTSSSSSTCLSPGIGCGTLGGFGWAPETTPENINKERSSSIESGGSVVFLDHKLHHDPSSDHHQHVQMIGLGLSSQPFDQWNQSLLRSDNKAETSFRVMVNSNANASTDVSMNASSSYQQESGSSQASLWRDSSANVEFKTQLSNRGFFLDHTQFSPHASSSDSTVTCQSFAMDNSSTTLYSNPNSSSNVFQGTFLGSDQPDRNQSSSLSYSQYGNFGLSPLRFSNNTTFWNPTAAAHDVSPRFFPAAALQSPEIQAPSFEEKPKVRK
ncbi:PREDICTED: transcription factor bHLH123-like [Tarenaya hassleriana]|uniref:transcription factor bHLH123-like n=1 Tax=Tarenaya hassleriana TaxID=28532 RepID=UPI00053CA456|nr:PREDICTED: transcription factor bHLH123-like [Tarenaya hassleriana]